MSTAERERMLTFALAAAARGYPVIPVRITGAGKYPAIPSAHPEGDPTRSKCRATCGQPGHGVWDATCDPERVAELFAAARRPNGYAVACGVAPQHILGLDLDRKSGHDGVALLARFAESQGFTVPESIRVATPSGGEHLWLTAPAGARISNSVGRIGQYKTPGIDIRSLGGQLVGPGSAGPPGAYRLVSAPETRPAAAPDALIRLLATPQRTAAPASQRIVSPGRRVHGLLDRLRKAQEGERNTMLFWASCRMAETVNDGGIGERDARDLLLAAATDIGLEFGEARLCVASAFARAGVAS